MWGGGCSRTATLASANGHRGARLIINHGGRVVCLVSAPVRDGRRDRLRDDLVVRGHAHMVLQIIVVRVLIVPDLVIRVVVRVGRHARERRRIGGRHAKPGRHARCLRRTRLRTRVLR